MLWIILLLLVLLIGRVIFLLNRLVGLRQMANNGSPDIDVQLKRRSDLTPRLVEMVKGYATHRVVALLC